MAEDTEQCKLLSGFFSYFLQSVIAILALVTLLYKRKIEKPQRDFVTWGFDVTKQVVGSVLVHMWNIALAIIINYANSTSTKPHADECALYFVSYWIGELATANALYFLIYNHFLRNQPEIMYLCVPALQTPFEDLGAAQNIYLICPQHLAQDVLFCTAAIIIILEGIQYLALRMDWTTIARSGYYGTPPSFRIFLIQMMVFIFVLLIVKTFLATMLILWDGPMESIANATLKPTLNNPTLELIFVMVISPMCGNILSFWVLDQVIMGNMGSRRRLDERRYLL